MSVKLTVENVYLRQDAVQLTRKHFWRLLGMMLVIVLVTSAADWGLTTLGDLITGPETEAAAAAVSSYAASETITSTEPMVQAVSQIFTSPKFWLFNLFYIVVTSLISNGLILGRHAQLIAAGRGGVPKVLGGFSRMRQCLKAWGLSLFSDLKIGLWALPGLAALLIGTELESYGQDGIGSLMNIAGVGLLFGLTIPAALSYSLSTFIMADEPDRGIRECVTLSKGLMKYRRWQYFKLGVPMILKMIGVFYASMLVFSLIGVAIGTGFSTVAAVIIIIVMLLAILLPILYFSLQFDMVCALFYLKRREPVSDAPASYWLRDHSKDDPAKAAPISAWLEEHAATDIEPAVEEAAESTDAPEESQEDSPEDISAETNEKKESINEEPVC